MEYDNVGALQEFLADRVIQLSRVVCGVDSCCSVALPNSIVFSRTNSFAPNSIAWFLQNKFIYLREKLASSASVDSAVHYCVAIYN